MSYDLDFLPSALKEWKKLDNSIRQQLKKKLAERLKNPRVEKDRLSGYKDVYKIKLRDLGYRLAYEVRDSEVIILVLVVGKREKNSVYDTLQERFLQTQEYSTDTNQANENSDLQEF